MSVVDSLEVKIEATSKGADAQIDKLIAKMGELAKELNMIDASKFQDLATIMKSFAHIMVSTKNNASAVNKAFDDIGNVGNVTKKAENSLKDLDKVVKDFSKTDFSYLKIPSTFFEQNKMLEKTESQLENLLSTEKKYIALGTDTGSMKWANLQFDIAETKARIDKLTEATNNYKDAMSSNFDNFKIEAPKIPISDMIKHEIDNNASATFERFGVSANSVIDSLKNNVTDLNLKMSDLAKLNIADSFEDITIDDSMPAELQSMIGQYSKLKELLFELEGIFNEMADDSRHFTDTSNGVTPFNRASDSLQEIMVVAKEMKDLEKNITDANREFSKFENKFKMEIAHESLEELQGRLAQLISDNRELNEYSKSWGKSSVDSFSDEKHSPINLKNYLEYDKKIEIVRERIKQLKNESVSSNQATEKSYQRMANAIKEATGTIATFNADINGVKVLTPLGNVASDIALAINTADAVLRNKPLSSTVSYVFDKVREIASSKLNSFNEIVGTNMNQVREAVGKLSFGPLLFGIDNMLNELKQSASTKLNQFKETIRTNISQAKEILSNTRFGALASTIGSAFKTLGKVIGVAIKGAIATVKGLVTGLKAVGKVARVVSAPLKAMTKMSMAPLVAGAKKLGGVFGGLGKQIKRVAKMYSLMLIRMALRKVIDNAKNSLNDLTRQNASVNDSVSSIVSSFKYLGASITGAFSPIFGVIAPILDALVEKCVSVINTIGQVFASLTGAKTYTFAKKVQTDYAGSLEDTKKATDDATKSAKEYENQLLGFDEITKLSAPTDNNSSGSSGSGADSGGSGYVFDTATIDNQYNNWADKLKEAWNNGDFTEIGEIVGRKLTDALDNINWDGIKQKCNKVASSFATFLNGFMEGADFTVIGETIAEVFNTALETGYTFLTTFNFKKFGEKIADLLNGAFDTIDWTLISNSVTTSIKKVFESVLTFSENFEWGENASKIANAFKTLFDGLDFETISKSLKELGGGIAESINAIFYIDDERSLGSDLSKAVWGAFNSLVDGLDKLIKDTKWANIGANFSQAIFGVFTDVDWKKLAKTISDSLLGVIDVLTGALKGVDWSKLGQDLVKAIKDVLTGIDWVKSLKKVGELFVEGIKAIFSITGGVLKGIGQSIIDEITKGFKNLKNNALELSAKVKLTKWGWTTLKAFLGIPSAGFSLKLKLLKSGFTSIAKWLGIDKKLDLKFKLPKIKVEWGEKTVAGFKIKFPKGFSTYAQGGFPSTGEMFIARESGPEMVGKIGNRTTVANNEQIVEGISSGVYSAVLSAMAQFGGNRSNVNVVLEGDAKGLFRVVQNEGKTYQMSTGLPVF